MIYRISDPADWQRAQQTGFFESADLAAEGFIHASELSQVLRTANKYYRGKTGLVLLELDETRLAEAGVRVVREDLTGSGPLFPHLYAPAPIHAVVRFFDLVEEDVGFALPPELA